MLRTFAEVASCAPSRKGDSYIYAIVPTISNGLAAITSADELLLLDLENLQSAGATYFADVPVGVTSMVIGDPEGTSIVCAGRDGTISTFDLRRQERVSRFVQDKPITALACLGNDVATGTELANHQAAVTVWDKRQNKTRWQSTENNDDITDLHFHLSDHTRLLSGGVDGLVSIFDTNIADEEDSLVQVVNHGPVHKAGFLNEKVVYALSSDEHLSLYPVSSNDDSEDPEPVMFGDLRERLVCEYAIDVSPSGLDGYLAMGVHSSNPRVEFRSIRDGELTPKPEFVLAGAHETEVVRSLFAVADVDAIFTSGEDGKIKGFRPSTDNVNTLSISKSKKQTKPEDSRFKPY